MESLNSPFLSPFPKPSINRPAKPRPAKTNFVIRSSTKPFTLSDGFSDKKPIFRKKRPLSDDDARRIILKKAGYLSRLRRNQGPHAQTPKWIKRTPQQMERLLKDDRSANLYGKHVMAAVKRVRELAARKEGDYDIREVLGGFVTKLSFEEMCVVLKEQRGWRQVRDFFGWMKLQLCYRPSVIVYTIIIRLYGQVGKIKLAEQMFLEMLEAGCEPDEVACGTMLCSYARWGRHKDMLLFYSTVRRREILLPVPVYNFMLSSLQKKKMHGKVINLWKQMLDTGLEPDRFTYTVAISSFAKEALPDEALDAYARMRNSGFVPEEATYSLLISLTSKSDREVEALRLYEEMKTQGIIPSLYTYASLLSLYYKNSDYSKALVLFSEMEKNNIIPDEVIYGILVRIYGKVGLYDDAQRTFKEIEKFGLLTDEKTYIAMAQVHLNVGNYDKAMGVLQLMKHKDVKLSKFSYNTLLRCYVALKDVSSAEATFHALSKFDALDAICYNDMLDLYCRLGLLEKAKALITQINKNKVSFNEELYKTIIEVYCREGMKSDAKKMIEEMKNCGLSIDKINMAPLMIMYGQSGELQQAENLFRELDTPDAASCASMFSLYHESGDILKSKEMMKSLLDMNNGALVVSQMIMKSAREGDLAKVEMLHHQSAELAVRLEDTSLASIISLYGRNQKLSEAIEVYAWASKSCPVGKEVYISMIDVYCKSGKVNDAVHLFRDMLKHGHAPTAVICSVLVNMLNKHGKYHDAEQIIEEIFNGNVELDTIAYNTFIKAMLDSGKLHSAVDIYDHMITSGVSPSIQTYNTMISVYGQGGKLEKAIDMFRTAQGMGVSLDEKAYTNMISYYGKVGKSKEALQLFNRMKEQLKPGKISYNVMLNAYATAGLHNEANDLFHEMQQDGHNPDSISYLALIKAYIQNHDFSVVESILSNMQSMGVFPSNCHFNQLILAYVREGSINSAKRIFSQMRHVGLVPDLACCRSMMRGYFDHGLVDEGILFYEQVNSFIKPDGFILSAAVHLYDFIGKNKEAEDVLDTMNIEGHVFLRNLKIGSKSDKHSTNVSR